QADRSHEQCLVLELIDIDFRDLFELLVANVCAAVFAAFQDHQSILSKPRRHQAKAFGRALKRWCREYPDADTPLGPKPQRGLHAELWFLREYLLPYYRQKKISPAVALQYWVGPLGQDHDFQFPRCGVEVKAVSASDEDPKVQISNEFQLDPSRRARGQVVRRSHDLLKLFLCCVFLRDTEKDESIPTEEDGVINKRKKGEAGETLFEMVDSLRPMLSKNHSAFWTKLNRAGYRKVHEDEYKKIRRIVAQDSRPLFYEVADRGEKELFPRIIRSDFRGTGEEMPASISRVKYYLRLEDIQGFACSSENDELGAVVDYFL
ncbi:MAG: PD-(D/E)XK motif protein, partial [Chthoniobacteraceae bacterium]